MDLNELLDVLGQRFRKRKSFVVYHKPESGVIRAWLPEEAVICSPKDVPEPGFVFAPFDSRYKTFLFPLASSEFVEVRRAAKEEDEVAIDPVDHLSSDGPFQKSVGETNADKVAHLELVQESIDFIRSGKASKIVISRREEADLGDLGPLDIYRTLLDKYPEAFVYLWYHPVAGMWAGASPELLLRVKNEFFQTMSLAGTRLYQGDKEVAWEAKELEEQELVTSLIQRELKPYLTDVGKAYDQRAGQLVHLRTDIRGKIPPGSHPGTIVEKLHPTAAVCGIPRTRAMEFILSREGYSREYYTGYLGELLGPDEKESNLFVNLRCMQLVPEQKKAWLYVGGGITASSDPLKEWEETVAKSKTMKRAFS